MNALAMSTVRHTHNYETMLHFYREILGMKTVEAWDEPANRGSLLSPGGLQTQEVPNARSPPATTTRSGTRASRGSAVIHPGAENWPQRSLSLWEWQEI